MRTITTNIEELKQYIDFDFQIILCDLQSVPETVTTNEDGSYTIFVNKRFTVERQKQSAFHALNHIINGDFDKYNADEIEADAHK